MPEPVEVAIELALIARARAFATAQGIAISLPNIAFTPPADKTVVGGVTTFDKYLRATFLPVPSFELGIGFSSNNQHYGMLQIDVFYGQGAGEPAIARVAAAVISYFKRGTEFSNDGFRVQINKAPYRSPILKDDPWMMIAVSIPYVCFAPSA